MSYTLTCAIENLDERRYRELVLQILDTIAIDVHKLVDVEIVELCDTHANHTFTEFLRFILTDIDGAVTVVDTTLNGTTTYTPTGIISKCQPHIYAGDACYSDAGVIKQAKAFYTLGNSSNLFYRDSTSNAILTAPVIVPCNMSGCASELCCVTDVNQAVDINGFTEETYAELVSGGHFPLTFSIAGTGFKYGNNILAHFGAQISIAEIDADSYLDILTIVSTWLSNFNSPIMFSAVTNTLTQPYAENGVMTVFYGEGCEFYLPLRIQSSNGIDYTMWLAAYNTDSLQLVENGLGSNTVIDLYTIINPMFMDIITHTKHSKAVSSNLEIPVWFNWGV